MNITKLSSTAKKLSVFFRVLRKIVGITTIVMLCVLVVLTIANAVNPDTVIGTELNVLELGSVSLELKTEETPSNNSLLVYAWCLGILGSAWAAVLYIGIGYVRKILAPMEAGQPFGKETGSYFKKLAVLSIVWGIAENIGTLLEGHVALKVFGLDQLAGSDALQSISINYNLDLTFLAVFGLLMLMSYVFNYGAELQKLSDETL
ncbi:MAG: hypothetical protein E7223_01950 [Clostridiales bacterium]|nr:hypothetical protein [Clostridiales bacterium]